MPEFVKQHYIPNSILKNFGNRKSNNKYEVCLIDLLESTVEYRNTASIMYAKNIYDTDGADVKELERKLKTNIEEPMFRIMKKISNDVPDEINISRKEMEIIKKYMLIQIFRTSGNREGYANPPAYAKPAYDYNIKEGETPLDFWKRELMTILDNDWSSLVNSTDLSSVTINAREIHAGFFIFFKTDEEFVINDRGHVCERFPLDVNENLMESTKEYFKTTFNINDSDKIDELLRYSENYIDTGIWMPLSANLAVVNAHGIFTNYINGFRDLSTYPIRMQDSKLLGYLPPEKPLKNKEEIDKRTKEIIEEHKAEIAKLSSDQKSALKCLLGTMIITKNKNDDDMYRYKINKLGARQTMDWNLLVMNEVYRFLCIKSPLKFIPTIEEYNQMKSEKPEGFNKDYSGYEDKIKLL